MPAKVERLRIECQTCGTVFYDRASQHRKFCSRACGDVATAKKYAAARIERTCQCCGKSFAVRPCLRTSRYCSLACKQKFIAVTTAHKRSQTLRGKGSAPDGGLLPTTYTKLHGRHLHRVVAEAKLGRALLPGEVVHHIDGNRHNNHPDNLDVITQSEHARLHSTKGRVCSIEGCGRKHAAKGYCAIHWGRLCRVRKRKRSAG